MSNALALIVSEQQPDNHIEKKKRKKEK